MDQKHLHSLKHWFAEYVSTFSTPVQEDQQNLDVKKHHTDEVCLNAVRIARDLKLSDEDMLLAETIALFHDVGRFLQYQQYKTFQDSISVNHGALGASVLLEKKVLLGLDKPEQDLIIKAITLHNVNKLPDGLDSRTLLFSRLVRDADKLDIWRVVIEYYGQDPATRASAVGLGLVDSTDYSRELLDSVVNGEIGRVSSLKTENDLRLVQLAWIYDLNYAESFRMVLERGYIDALRSYLPVDDAIKKAVGVVRAYVERKLE
jgi:putative nucleotidyltransferase with HDIG domain